MARRVPIFVERGTYRRRRVADAARLLPVVGVILFLLPLLWVGSDGESGRTAWVMSYIFVVWAVLAVLSGVLSRYLVSEDDARHRGGTGGDDVDGDDGDGDDAGGDDGVPSEGARW